MPVYTVAPRLIHDAVNKVHIKSTTILSECLSVLARYMQGERDRCSIYPSYGRLVLTILRREHQLVNLLVLPGSYAINVKSYGRGQSCSSQVREYDLQCYL